MSSADDEVMNNEWLRCNEALGASYTVWCPWRSLYLAALLATARLVSLPVTFLLCFEPGVLKWVISVTFWAFLTLLRWNILEGGCCHDSFASNLSLSGHGACLPLPSVAQGTLYFVPWWTLLYLAGSLPWRFFSLSMGDVLDAWGSPLLLICQLLGCLQLGQDLVGASVALSQSASIFFWNETWDIL